jgi:Domain of unknown function (DUF929)
MSNRPKRRPSRSQAHLARAARRDRSYLPWIIAVAVVVVVGAALIAIVAGGDNAPPEPTATPDEIAAQLSAVDASVSESVGMGAAQALPKAIDAPALTEDGKPLVFYEGAEYCPFCAAQRWAMVTALSRFGTFSDLGLTYSAGDDVFPNTPTLSFHGSSFASDYVAFTGVETEDRDKQTLDTPTADQQALVSKYDAPPYTDSVGSIPFIDFGGEYILAGAIYSPDVLGDKTHDEIAAALADPGSDVAKSIVGSANVLTATICLLTDDQPEAACSSDTIAEIQQQISGG